MSMMQGYGFSFVQQISFQEVSGWELSWGFGPVMVDIGGFG